MSSRLKNARKRAGYTQKQVADSFGISREAVSLWESGGASSTKPDIGKLQKLAELYRISISELLGEDAPEIAGGENTGKDAAILAPDQQQMLLLMGRMNPDIRNALLKIGDLLSKLPGSAQKPDKDHGVIDEVKSVESGAGIIKTATYAGLNRRRKNLGRAPERRLDSKTYSDEHDLSDYVHNDNREEQIQKRGEIDD